MAKDEVKRQSQSTLKGDVDSLSALKEIKDYRPFKPEYEVAPLALLKDDMEKKQELETQLEKAWKNARDDANDAEWAFHNGILGAKDQVVAQFGVDSNQVQSIGLKKKSEYKRPGRRKGE